MSAVSLVIRASEPPPPPGPDRFKPQAENETSTDSCQAQVTPVVTALIDSSTSFLLQKAMVSVFPVDNLEEAINVRLIFDYSESSNTVCS